MGVLTKQELDYLEESLRRKANEIEQDIVGAEWSEHCSYKSSKKYLRLLPTKASSVVVGSGYDAGVLDVGDGYVLTVHIESHNHPSAVEPFGGAATGVGGVIRDILSAGTRPIAILDGLRFGDIEKDTHARWLFKNAVRGIADYGNCLGVPTVGGEIEFDRCFTNYALVDVAAIGCGKKEKLIKNHADAGDCVVLIGGSTGRDGIGGSQFASDKLEAENRSAVQIPDPFIEKLVIEAILEARNQNCIKAMKDLGGGGLSCAISETADALSVGIELDVSLIHKREENMSPSELMVSESQERMLVITDQEKLSTLKRICEKFHVPYSVIGSVTNGSVMEVRLEKEVIARLPSEIDGNSKHCYINPRQGAIGCFDEACRNVVCTGAVPIGMVDHLQFGNPEDPEVFWTFKESLEGITQYAKYFGIPCVGGKVSLYNQTNIGPIKPTPLIGVLGLIETKPLIPKKIQENDFVVL